VLGQFTGPGEETILKVASVALHSYFIHGMLYHSALMHPSGQHFFEIAGYLQKQRPVPVSCVTFCAYRLRDFSFRMAKAA
jgi:hypothetical protein